MEMAYTQPGEQQHYFLKRFAKTKISMWDTNSVTPSGIYWFKRNYYFCTLRNKCLSCTFRKAQFSWLWGYYDRHEFPGSLLPPPDHGTDWVSFEDHGWHGLWLWSDPLPAKIISRKGTIEIGVYSWCQAFQLSHIHLRFGSHSQHPTLELGLRKITFVLGNNFILNSNYINHVRYFIISLTWRLHECKTLIITFNSGVYCEAQEHNPKL